MKNIYSNIYSFNGRILKKTVKYLNQDNIVGMPTETVYGLAGNAYSDKAIKKIYKLKKRPKKNPLIVHYYKIKDAEKDVQLTKYFYKLYKKFCPGPITFVLKKKMTSKISPFTTASLNTVAIRFPNHNVIKSILKLLDFPLAMPSANLSSALSPVSAFDVYEEFKNKLNIIINASKKKIGIESTVIDLSGKQKILRPGLISSKEIKKILKRRFSKKGSIVKSPGMLKKHYSPGIPIFIGKKPKDDKCAYLVFGNKYKDKKNYFNLSKKGDLKEAASNLYKTMRKIKKEKYKKIFVSKIPNEGAGIAINDRLTRASK